MSSTEGTRRLGIDLPIVQGPFGGGLSTTRLAATVSNLGGLGSFGAHHLPPEEIGRVASELRSLTTRPFALNLWVSDHDPGGLTPGPDELDRVWRVLAPYFRELGVDRPELALRFQPRFEEQVEAVLEARPPVFSFIFGVPSPKVLAECRRRGIVTSGAATSIAGGARSTRRASTSSSPQGSRPAGTARRSWRAPRTRSWARSRSRSSSPTA